ncbi:MAG: M24 family metallopeptidase [Acidobacteriaceae bacterium]
MELDQIQTAIAESGADAWLFYDHHQRDPLAYAILGLPAAHVTRRWYYLIPAHGEPRKLVHKIESARLDALPGSKATYSSWQSHEAGLRDMLAPFHRIAMQYSPRNAIMYVSMVDAGTVELLREFGKEILSSADLVSQFQAVLSEDQIRSHYDAQQAIDSILAAAFDEIGRRAAAGDNFTEHDMVLWLEEAMRRENLVWENRPNVSVNENSSDSHYEPQPNSSRPIRTGDFLLIDIWARTNQPQSCYYDITWTAVIGREPRNDEQKIFSIVRDARDAAILAVKQAFAEHRPMHGWEADDRARFIINTAGYGDFFTHRTGHNISNILHGAGAHLDNLETHDERLILPNTCFSVEPGIYLPHFGVRSEINMITTPGSARVTGRVQNELLRL